MPWLRSVLPTSNRETRIRTGRFTGLFTVCLFFFRKIIDVSKNKTHCSTLHCLATAGEVYFHLYFPLIWSAFYVYDRDYSLLVPFLLCYILIQHPGFPVMRLYMYNTSANHDKWIRSGGTPVFRLFYHVPCRDTGIKVACTIANT